MTAYVVSPTKLDARSDLYAVGALGYFLLTGQPPFEGRSVVEICGQHLHSIPPSPSERVGRVLAADLDALILACLQKDPALRPACALSLARALDACAIPRWDLAHARSWWRERADPIARQRKLAADPPAWPAPSRARRSRSICVHVLWAASSYPGTT